MTATPALTPDLQRQVLTLEDDLRARLAGDPAREASWKTEHQEALSVERTATPWVAWRDDRITQVAVAWVLATVFVRFCEDNSLVGPVWITGPGGRRQEALDAQLEYFRANPEDTDREWLRNAIDYLAALPSTRDLVDKHSPLWLLAPSGDAAERLMEFWRRRDEDGTLLHDLADPSLSTRFLGDLYQNLSQHAKDTYALLQTPVFVEEFILDRTLEPALAERQLDSFRLIDPACGSGHFLLGAFARLLDRWQREAPGMEMQARAQAALDAVHGVDLNPFSIAIARFRLTVAALQACGLMSLEKAPAFDYHLAVGDSLIHGPDTGTLPGMEARAAFMPFTYETEDAPVLLQLLEEGRYDVVVGNPPYITVKDKALNRAYRSKYADVCKGTYHLTVPFMKLFFDLARSDHRPGWTGQITSNGFMKRGFGTKLIEEFLPHVDLRDVIDSEGAWIPGHNMDGTPTVIIVGRGEAPVRSTVRTVLSKGRRESRADGSEGKGPYWSSIVDHIDDPGWDDDWITVADLDRRLLNKHPWSLTGGVATTLRQSIEAASSRLGPRVRRIGAMAQSHADQAFAATGDCVIRLGLTRVLWPVVVSGDEVRDFSINSGERTYYPYDRHAALVPLTEGSVEYKWFWPLRTELANRATFSGGTYLSDGRPWYEWHQVPKDVDTSELSIAYAEVATHNHFVLDRGGRVFKQTAPVIKLPAGATEDKHLAFFGVLNSSAACFWLKQQSQPKGGAADHLWLRTYQVAGTSIGDYPLPRVLPLERARILDALAVDLAENSPESVAAAGTLSSESFASARAASGRIRARMIFVQEELDWEVYRAYGLVDDDLTYDQADVPGLAQGERAFEITLARAAVGGQADSTWFTRPEQRATPILEIPAHWPARYRDLVKRRLDVIASNQFIWMLEKPEYKRRWAQEPWEKRQDRALRDWLLDRLENRKFWFDPQGRPLPHSVGQLADDVDRDWDLTSVLALWEGRPDVPTARSLTRLLEDEAVPFLAAYRYKESGLRKRQGWEETWDAQRREDAGQTVGVIPVPPKYTSADFHRQSYWAARGKLDVPKERFILYPDAGRDTDPTPVLGWAGWDHAQQSLALSIIIGEREKDGWTEKRLVPVVAGLAELQPWVEQWYADLDPAYGVSMAAFCGAQLTAKAAQVGKTLAELAAWRPAAAPRGRRPPRQAR